MGVVRGDGAALLEERPAVLHRLDVALVGSRVHAGDLAQAVHVRNPRVLQRLQVLVRTEGGDHLGVDLIDVRDLRVHLQIVTGIVRGGDELDPEALEELARAVVIRLQERIDAVIDLIRRLRRGSDIDIEDILHLRLEPVLHLRATELLPQAAEDPETLAGVRIAELRTHRDAEFLQPHPVRVEEAVHVVVRGEQQFCGVLEGRVLRKPLRRHVPMRGDDRQVLHRVIELPRDLPQAGFRREQAVRMDVQRRCSHAFEPSLWPRSRAVGCRTLPRGWWGGAAGNRAIPRANKPRPRNNRPHD